MTAAASTHRIETPEGVVFSFPLASPLTRALAFSIDAAAVAALSALLADALRIFAVAGADFAAGLTVLLSFVLSIGYGILLEWRWRGQTLGKRVLRLRVVDAHGLRLEFGQIALRNILRAIDMLPALYLVGGIAAFVNAKGQRLGDVAAGTIVVSEPPLPALDLDRIAPAKYNSLLAYPHLAARLRNRVSSEVVGLSLKALSLRDRYEPSARIVLFAELAEYFRSLAPFPTEAVDGLTDEQYVRSVICALYGTAPRLKSIPSQTAIS